MGRKKNGVTPFKRWVARWQQKNTPDLVREIANDRDFLDFLGAAQQYRQEIGPEGTNYAPPETLLAALVYAMALDYNEEHAQSC
jgi:hypothetical protein